MAENIILDALWTRMFTTTMPYFNFINIGTGNGELSAARTSLFTHLASLTLSDTPVVSASLEDDYISCRRSAQIIETDYVGQSISEIGIAHTSGASSLVTHAALRDMNGNPTTIEKKATDIITFYATIYLQFPSNNGRKFSMSPILLDTWKEGAVPYVYAGMVISRDTGFRNWVADWLMGLWGWATSDANYAILFSRGEEPLVPYGAYNSSTTPTFANRYNNSYGAYATPTITRNSATKSVSFYGRLPADSLNSKQTIRSISLHRRETSGSSVVFFENTPSCARKQLRRNSNIW
jgi:hypothetical protein